MKTITKLFLSLLVISFIAVSTVYAQKPGSTSMQYLEVLPCARATAVGEAYSVWASGAEAVFWNPAGVALVQQTEFSTTYTKWIFDASIGALSCATSLGNFGAVGLQLQYVDYGNMDESIVGTPYNPEVGYLYNPGRQFKPYSYVVGLTYAKSLTNSFSTGVTVKYSHESLYDQKTVSVVTAGSSQAIEYKTYGRVVLFDFGMRFNAGYRTVQVAAAVQNFGSDIAYATEMDKSPSPMLFRVGIAADLLGPNSLLFQAEDQKLGVAMDLFQANDSGQHVHIGMEYEYASTIALRLGYKSNYDAEGFSFGAGVRQNLGGLNISFDYSVGLTTLVVGNVHRISLGVGL